MLIIRIEDTSWSLHEFEQHVMKSLGFFSIVLSKTIIFQQHKTPDTKEHSPKNNPQDGN